MISRPSNTSRQVLGIGEAGRRLGVVLGEGQRIGQQERVEPRRRAGPPVARIDARQARLPPRSAGRGAAARAGPSRPRRPARRSRRSSRRRRGPAPRRRRRGRTAAGTGTAAAAEREARVAHPRRQRRPSRRPCSSTSGPDQAVPDSSSRRGHRRLAAVTRRLADEARGLAPAEHLLPLRPRVASAAPFSARSITSFDILSTPGRSSAA